MIPAGVQVYVASTPVDFRKGATGLMALVRDGGADPFSGALYVFRSKRADRIKAVWFDGTGVCLFAKTLEEVQFCWPRIGPGSRTAGPSGYANSPHPSSREGHLSTALWSSSFLLSGLILNGFSDCVSVCREPLLGA